MGFCEQNAGHSKSDSRNKLVKAPIEQPNISKLITHLHNHLIN